MRRHAVAALTCGGGGQLQQASSIAAAAHQAFVIRPGQCAAAASGAWRLPACGRAHVIGCQRCAACVYLPRPAATAHVGAGPTGGCQAQALRRSARPLAAQQTRRPPRPAAAQPAHRRRRRRPRQRTRGLVAAGHGDGAWQGWLCSLALPLIACVRAHVRMRSIARAPGRSGAGAAIFSSLKNTCGCSSGGADISSLSSPLGLHVRCARVSAACRRVCVISCVCVCTFRRRRPCQARQRGG